nr:MAG TPA: hypothetical protein [Caudoviricetes sp.]
MSCVRDTCRASLISLVPPVPLARVAPAAPRH